MADFGESVGPDYGSTMEWIELSQAWERLTVSTFLGRWKDRIGYCTLDGDGNFYSLAKGGDVLDDGSLVTRWSKVVSPDQVLVPQRKADHQ